MKIYLDTASVPAIEKYRDIIDGVTSNPAIMAKEGTEQMAQLKKMCAAVPTLPVSGEVIYANSTVQVIDDARKIHAIAPNIVVKIPGNLVGLKAIRQLKSEGMKLNVTAMMTAKQLSYAALLGADYVSIFYCRARDAGLDPVCETNLAKEFIDMNGLPTEIIVGSIRNVDDVAQILLTRGDIATITPELLEESFTHQKTQFSIDEFAERYEKALAKQPETYSQR